MIERAIAEQWEELVAVTWKLYRVLADDQGAVENYLRVVDDSGEDYLYPASRFVGVDFPESVSSQLLAAVQPV